MCFLSDVVYRVTHTHVMFVVVFEEAGPAQRSGQDDETCLRSSGTLASVSARIQQYDDTVSALT